MNSDNSSDRLAQHLRLLAAGLPPGGRLPSVRTLMRELAVGPVTVRQAVDRLSRDGTLEARPGIGTFTRGRTPRPAAAADLGWQSVALGPGRVETAALSRLCLVAPDRARALNAGYLPQELQATAAIAAAAARVLRRPGVWSRMPVEGLEALRAWFAAGTGGCFSAHEVTICPGTQAANAAAFRALARPGDPMLIESPTYVGAIAAARAAGLELVPVPTDADGLRPGQLEAAFARTGARLLYCQPTYAVPTGTVLEASRRAAVLACVVRAGAFLIEDDWARDFHLGPGPAPPPLCADDRDGHVILVRSLTKSAAPGLRIGAICAKGAALERLRAARLTDDFFVPGLLQETALQLVTAPGWPRHLRGLQGALRERRDGLAAAVRRHLGPQSLGRVPAGGLHLWVALPPGVSDLAVEHEAEAAGILVSAGRHWHPAEADRPMLRLSFGAAGPDWIDGCVAALAGIVAEASGRAMVTGRPGQGQGSALDPLRAEP